MEKIKEEKTPPHGDVFHDMFLKTYDLWKQGHNIFYADIDTICIHPIKIFGEFNKFTMFNGVIAGPISDNNLEGLAVQMSETINYMPLREGKIGNIEIPTYFNDGVRYFPAETSEKVWEIGEEAWEAWKSRKDMWGEQQIIHNKMLYEGQEWNNDYTTCQRPDLNHFNLGDEHEVLDQPKEYFKDYHIYHLFSSRGLVDCLEAMKEVKHKED